MYKFELPSGNVITFREPKNADRKRALDMVQPQEKISIDELLAAICVTEINGREPAYRNDKTLMGEWTLKDGQTYVNLFLEMFTVGDDDMKEIKEAAKKLLSPVTENSSDSEQAQF